MQTITDEDRRPWKDVETKDGRKIVVAEANLHLIRSTGRDDRWPVGSAMNPIPPGESRSSAHFDKFKVGLGVTSATPYGHPSL